MGVLFVLSEGQRLLLKSVHTMNQTSWVFFLREVYQNNYTLCYTSISTSYECSYFEISVAKQSYMGVLSNIIMLVNSEWRAASRHQCYFVGEKHCYRQPLSSDCQQSCVDLHCCLFSHSHFFRLFQSHLYLFQYLRAFSPASPAHLKCTALFSRLNLMTNTSAI